MELIDITIGTILGFLSGLGVGGGSLLMLWLTRTLDLPTAREINLLFFLPSALISTLFRWKQGHLPLKKVFPAILSGCISAVVFSMIGSHMELSLLRKLFGGLLLFTGIRELRIKKDPRHPEK